MLKIVDLVLFLLREGLTSLMFYFYLIFLEVKKTSNQHGVKLMYDLVIACPKVHL